MALLGKQITAIFEASLLSLLLSDGITDDTAAIQRAMSDGNRCGPGSCESSTTTPAVVYFPAGTYLLSQSIIMYYYTQMIGNPNAMPVLKATAGFSGLGLIDGDMYEPGNAAGVLEFGGSKFAFIIKYRSG